MSWGIQVSSIYVKSAIFGNRIKHINFSDDDSKYLATFKATGCLPLNDQRSPKNLKYWKSQSDSTVFGDMMSYCETVRDGTAAEYQKIKCCGSKDCTVSTCTRQTTWSYLETKNIGI